MISHFNRQYESDNKEVVKSDSATDSELCPFFLIKSLNLTELIYQNQQLLQQNTLTQKSVMKVTRIKVYSLISKTNKHVSHTFCV